MLQDVDKAMHRAIRDMRASTARAIADAPALTGSHMLVPYKAGVAIDTWIHLASRKGAPVVYDFHGGGFALGDARKTDAMQEWVSCSWDVNVVSVGYRLAPENPFPCAMEDAVGVIEWYGRRANEFGFGDFAIAQGFSAGANLALVAALRFARRGDDALGGLVLHYPVFDAMSDPALKSVRAIDVPVEFMAAFNRWYAAGERADNPDISPVYAPKGELALLPKTVIAPVVGDALCDEALLFASRMKSAGGHCEVMPVANAYHGYIEDAANDAVYAATSFPETRAARPAGYRAVAEQSMREALRRVLGRETSIEAFPS